MDDRGMGKRMERKSLDYIISRNEGIPIDKVDEWVEKVLIWADKKGIIRYVRNQANKR